jgi:hypothetical protein
MADDRKCFTCGHAWSLHVTGHQCAGTVYEGGTVCPCEERQCIGSRLNTRICERGAVGCEVVHKTE